MKKNQQTSHSHLLAYYQVSLLIHLYSYQTSSIESTVFRVQKRKQRQGFSSADWWLEKFDDVKVERKTQGMVLCMSLLKDSVKIICSSHPGLSIRFPVPQVGYEISLQKNTRWLLWDSRLPFDNLNFQSVGCKTWSAACWENNRHSWQSHYFQAASQGAFKSDLCLSCFNQSLKKLSLPMAVWRYIFWCLTIGRGGGWKGLVGQEMKLVSSSWERLKICTAQSLRERESSTSQCAWRAEITQHKLINLHSGSQWNTFSEICCLSPENKINQLQIGPPAKTYKTKFTNIQSALPVPQPKASTLHSNSFVSCMPICCQVTMKGRRRGRKKRCWRSEALQKQEAIWKSCAHHSLQDSRHSQGVWICLFPLLLFLIKQCSTAFNSVLSGGHAFLVRSLLKKHSPPCKAILFSIARKCPPLFVDDLVLLLSWWEHSTHFMILCSEDKLAASLFRGLF